MADVDVDYRALMLVLVVVGVVTLGNMENLLRRVPHPQISL